MGEYADYTLDYYTSKRHGFSIDGHNDKYLRRIYKKKERNLADRKTVYIRGKLYWAKIFDLVPNYSKDGMEWTFELTPDEDGERLLKDEKVADRLKDVQPDKNGNYLEGREGTKFIRLTQRQFRMDGKANDAIKVIDGQNQPWDDRLLGNGTVADVKVTIADYGKGKKKGIYPQAIRVLDLVPYEKNDDFAPIAKDDKYFKEPAPKRDTFKEDFGLDDELPI